MCVQLVVDILPSARDHGVASTLFLSAPVRVAISRPIHEWQSLSFATGELRCLLRLLLSLLPPHVRSIKLY